MEHAILIMWAEVGRGFAQLGVSVVLLVFGWPVPGRAQTCTASSLAVTGVTGAGTGLVADGPVSRLPKIKLPDLPQC